MLVTVSLVAGQNQSVSTPIGVLNPGDLPISQVVRPVRIEQVGADLRSLEALGLISFTVADDPATDDRCQLISRNAQSALSPLEIQGEDITLFVKLASGGATGTADDVTIIAAGAFRTKLRILDVMAIVTTGVAAATWTLRDTVGGAGTALTSALSAATSGSKVRDALTTATQVMLTSKGLFMRRSDRSTVGELVIWARSEY